MRKNIIFSVMLTLCVVVLSFACIKTDGVNKATVQNNKTDVLTVSQNSAVENKALEARFLNMLNHNFVYNDAFYDDSALANDSMIALLDVAENSFLDEAYLSDYIFNMYGKIYKDFSFLGENLPQKEGCVYIIPRGYSEYKHSVISITDNKDGSYTVLTEVEVLGEENQNTMKCETLFLTADDSAFGYNIMYSEIIEVAAVEVDC